MILAYNQTITNLWISGFIIKYVESEIDIAETSWILSKLLNRETIFNNINKIIPWYINKNLQNNKSFALFYQIKQFKVKQKILPLCHVSILIFAWYI